MPARIFPGSVPYGYRKRGRAASDRFFGTHTLPPQLALADEQALKITLDRVQVALNR
jgi:hypothetical protein